MSYFALSLSLYIVHFVRMRRANGFKLTRKQDRRRITRWFHIRAHQNKTTGVTLSRSFQRKY